jgi:hypothetical protein
MSALTGARADAPAYDGHRVGIVEVVTSKERFLVVCPCAAIILTYVSELLDRQNLVWTFGKAIVRATHTSAMFVCVDPTDDAHELWISARWVAPGEWALRHSQVPDW